MLAPEQLPKSDRLAPGGGGGRPTAPTPSPLDAGLNVPLQLIALPQTWTKLVYSGVAIAGSAGTMNPGTR